MRSRLLPLALAVFAISMTATAAPAIAAEPSIRTAVQTDAACTVTGGQVTWGFKESFRSYISGTIAKGAWEPIDGASYTTPSFSWPATGGEIDPATGTGTVSFGGGVRFTGHNGLLDTTIANPTLTIAADGTAQVLLDVSGVSMEDALAGATDNVQTAAQVDFVDVDLAAAPLVVSDTAVSGTAAPTTITADGFAQFGNYEAGTAFDPLSFEVQLTCPEPEPAAEASPEPEMTTLAAEDSAQAAAPVWIWGAGVALVAAAAATVVAVLLRRRRSAS